MKKQKTADSGSLVVDEEELRNGSSDIIHCGPSRLYVPIGGNCIMVDIYVADNGAKKGTVTRSLVCSSDLFHNMNTAENFVVKRFLGSVLE